MTQEKTKRSHLSRMVAPEAFVCWIADRAARAGMSGRVA